jgi:hypothetical protein
LPYLSPKQGRNLGIKREFTNDDSNQTVALPLGAWSSITRNDRKITVEDSVETISDLIAEIQATERVDIPIPAPTPTSPSTSIASVHVSGPMSPIRFSLARQKRTSNPSSNLLPSIRKFFHTLLSTIVIILPVRSDSRASPIKTNSEVNDLHATSARIFFRAAKSNSSLAGDFHVSSTLSFEELTTLRI